MKIFPIISIFIISFKVRNQYKNLSVDVIVVSSGENMNVPHHLEHIQALLKGLRWQPKDYQGNTLQLRRSPKKEREIKPIRHRVKL